MQNLNAGNRCKLQWEHRNKYLQKVLKKLNSRQKELIFNTYLHTETPEIFMTIKEYEYLIKEKQRKSEETKSIYFVKTFNRFFDDDRYLRSILNELIDDLDIRDSVEITISNKTERTLSTFLF